MSYSVSEAADAARLSSMEVRIALIVAEVEGTDKAMRFIESCRLEDAATAARPPAIHIRSRTVAALQHS